MKYQIRRKTLEGMVNALKDMNTINVDLDNDYYLSSSTLIPYAYNNHVATLLPIDVSNIDEIELSWVKSPQLTSSLASLSLRYAGFKNGNLIMNSTRYVGDLLSYTINTSTFDDLYIGFEPGETGETCNNHILSCKVKPTQISVSNIPKILKKSTYNIPYINSHCDRDGIWHRPNNWPDIESISLDDGEDVMYFVVHGGAPNDFICLSVGVDTACTLELSRGTISSSGVYTPSSSTTGCVVTASATATSAKTICLVTEQLSTKWNAVRLRATTSGVRFKKCIFTSPPASTSIPGTSRTLSSTLSSYHNSVYMMYGRISNCADIVNSYYSKVRTLESIKFVDFLKNLPAGGNASLSYLFATDCTTAKIYYASNLQRVHFVNNYIGQRDVKIFNGMYLGCSKLCDMNAEARDMSGWVKSTTWRLDSMFLGVYNLKGTIKVSNWDLSGLDDSNSLRDTFRDMRNIDYIDGTDSWHGYVSVLGCSFNQTFQNDYKLKSAIDLSGLTLASSNGFQSAFERCYCIPSVKLPTVLSYNSSSSTWYYLVKDCMNLKSIDFSKANLQALFDTVSISNFLTCAFDNTGLEEITFENINFCRNSSLSMRFNRNLKTINFINCTRDIGTRAAYGVFSYDSDFVAGCDNLKSLDLSWVDCSTISNQGNTYLFGINFSIVDYYPPTNLGANTSGTLYISYNNGMGSNLNTCTGFGLSKESLLRIFNNLATTSTTKTIKIGPWNNILTAEEKAIATNKGWTVANS